MKNKKIIIFIMVITIIFIIGLLFFNFFVKGKKFEDMNVDEKVNYLIDNMTLEQKIAQMLVVYYSSEIVDNSLIESLQEHPFGGFILVENNITTYDKTKKFVDDLQANSSIPLIISIDQEGGGVQRLQYLTDVNPTNIPYMYDLGNMNDEELAYNVGKVMAEELRTIGVNVVYAPVLDVYSNSENTVIGKRSFGTTKNIVSSIAISLGKGLEDNGIIATYKHFPGHGDTTIDSHYKLPIINKTYSDLKELELEPFNNAIKNDAKIIMIGHIALPKIKLVAPT